MRIFEAQKWIRRLEIGNATLYTVLVMEQIPGFSIMAPPDTKAIGASSETQSPTNGDTSSDTVGDTFGDIYYIDNNINKNSLSPAREGEVFEIFSKDTASLDEIAGALHCERKILENMLPDFFQECRIKKKNHQTVQECKDHFFNWARARLERERNNGIPKENKPGGSRKGNQRGRRTPIKPNCGLIED